MKIVNLEGYAANPGDLSWEPFKKYGDLTVYDRTNPEDIIERAKDAEVLFINKSIITAKMLDKMPRLKYVGIQATGYNVIDCKAARERNITVTNVPAYSTNAVAQLVFAFILQVTNKVSHYSDAVHSGAWCSSPDFCYLDGQLYELDGKTIGILGFGSIGQRVANLAKAFGMNVLVSTPHPDPEKFGDVEFTDTDSLLRNSDVITCHCPLTDKTKGLIGEDAFLKMKKSAIFINTSRGPVVDEDALANALNSKKIMAAGIDVLSLEPPKEDNPLLCADNCFITPHIAWAGFETRKRLLKILEENLKAYIDGKPQNVVN